MRIANITDFQLRGCNKWVLPDGTKRLQIAHTVAFYQLINTGQILNDLEIATPPQHDFICKVVSSTCVTPGTLVQIQWPDGRYLSNPGFDIFSFAGTGRRGRLVSPHKFCPKSSKIRVNLDNSLVTANANIELYFEGVVLVDMV